MHALNLLSAPPRSSLSVGVMAANAIEGEAACGIDGHQVPSRPRPNPDRPARTLGVSQPAVARLESGDHEPTVATLARLAHKLRISLRLDVDPESVILSPAS